MYICMCHPFTEKDVQCDLAGCGSCPDPLDSEVLAVYERCAGCYPQCGKCLDMLRDVIESYCKNTTESVALSCPRGVEGED